MAHQVALKQYQPSNYIDLNQLYTSGNIKHIIMRQCEFLRARPYGTLHGRLLPVSLMLTGGFVGYCAATKAAEMIKTEKGKPVLQSTGMVIGCGAGVYIYTTLIEKDLFFKTWKFLRLSSITNDFIFKNHEKDDFLNQFVDCLHYTPLKVPVRLATGHLIDLDSLKSIRPDKNGDILCPHTREKLDLNHPRIDLELGTLILKRCQYLLQQDLNKLDANSESYQATQLQLKVVEAQLEVLHEKHIKGLEQLQSEGKITNVEFNLLQFQFYSFFGVVPAGHADPERGIDTHIMDFNLNWKKIISDHSKMIFKGTPPTQFLEDV